MSSQICGILIFSILINNCAQSSKNFSSSSPQQKKYTKNDIRNETMVSKDNQAEFDENFDRIMSISIEELFQTVTDSLNEMGNPDSIEVENYTVYEPGIVLANVIEIKENIGMEFNGYENVGAMLEGLEFDLETIKKDFVKNGFDSDEFQKILEMHEEMSMRSGMAYFNSSGDSGEESYLMGSPQGSSLNLQYAAMALGQKRAADMYQPKSDAPLSDEATKVDCDKAQVAEQVGYATAAIGAATCAFTAGVGCIVAGVAAATSAAGTVAKGVGGCVGKNSHIGN